MQMLFKKSGLSRLLSFNLESDLASLYEVDLQYLLGPEDDYNS